MTHEIHMSQCKYIKQLLNDYNKYNIKVYDTPMDSRTPFSRLSVRRQTPRKRV